MTEIDPVFARDSRVFLAFMEQALGHERTRALGNVVSYRAAAIPGPPSSTSWFQAWAEVLSEYGTEDDKAAAATAMRNVKKLHDAGW